MICKIIQDHSQVSWPVGKCLISWLCLKPSNGEDHVSYAFRSSIASFFSNIEDIQFMNYLNRLVSLEIFLVIDVFWSWLWNFRKRLSLYPMRLQIKWMWTFWVFSTLEKMVLVFSRFYHSFDTIASCSRWWKYIGDSVLVLIS